jgi:hypothetical protein
MIRRAALTKRSNWCSPAAPEATSIRLPPAVIINKASESVSPLKLPSIRISRSSEKTAIRLPFLVTVCCCRSNFHTRPAGLKQIANSGCARQQLEIKAVSMNKLYILGDVRGRMV